ncbi:PaaI family thioesterase [Lutimaribacter sp. EGI FJ00015]|uniref:PaaI family thioesterase n=1 Tax=Lutimaribacter degradans TaxID=2945989 RepID=A0ACC6A2L9_9RHOB|nr:PaaI family thioesterase [Lutimaribacter sp. EGI FJ00013]MCM2563834.1 PaaI family thioesterase [Lutimaribacter sp. EGI FJ00013]MCO0615011.1 PaaI family thioesterase [Lutimaribacter sp. EGI FJ00015]MCO0637675.1 PaaI family thioesterase [Lutimaribacter sp. EGI FJ00014]
MTVSVAEAEKILEQSFAPWVRALDIRVDIMGTDRATLSIPITDQIARVGGIVSGQAQATLADTSMVFACFAHLGAPLPVATTNLDTQFLRPGTGERLRCEAHVVRAGKALIFARADLLTAPGDKLVAQATATFFKPQV